MKGITLCVGALIAFGSLAMPLRGDYVINMDPTGCREKVYKCRSTLTRMILEGTIVFYHKKPYCTGDYEASTKGKTFDEVREMIKKYIKEHPDDVYDFSCFEGTASTPLIAAVSICDPEIVQALLEAGAMPYAPFGSMFQYGSWHSDCPKELKDRTRQLIIEAQARETRVPDPGLYNTRKEDR